MLKRDKSHYKQRAASKETISISQALLNIITKQRQNVHTRRYMPQPIFGWQYKLKIAADEMTVWLAMTWPVTHIQDNSECNNRKECGMLQELLL